jgi:hypothetical protein
MNIGKSKVILSCAEDHLARSGQINLPLLRGCASTMLELLGISSRVSKSTGLRILSVVSAIRPLRGADCREISEQALSA